jgi:hypothetical protein
MIDREEAKLDSVVTYPCATVPLVRFMRVERSVRRTREVTPRERFDDTPHIANYNDGPFISK